MSPVDFDRLVDRLAIASEVAEISERQQERALAAAEELLRPKLQLRGGRRVVLTNAPEEAHRRVLPLLAHHHDSYGRSSIEPVAAFVGHPNPRDVEYRALPTAAGRDLLALLEIDLAPGVQVRRFNDGRADLLVTFD